MFKNVNRNILAGLIGLLIVMLFPFFNKGMFFAMDSVWPEKIAQVSPSDSMYIFWQIMYFLNQIFAVDVVQKIIYGAMFAVLLLGSYINAPFKKQSSKIVFATIVTFNPFVFSRFLAGQYAVVWGYSLFIQLFLTSLERESLKKYLWFCLYLMSMSIISIHYTFLAFIYATIYLSLHAFYLRNLHAKYAWPILVFIVLFSAKALLVISNSANVAYFMGFGSADIKAFATVEDATFGLVPNVLGMFGFWFENTEKISLKNYVGGVWPIFTVVLIFLSSLGTRLFLQKEGAVNRVGGKGFLIFLGICLSLAILPAVEFFQPVVQYIFDKLHIFFILREPQKAVGVLVIFYAFFVSYFLDRVDFDKYHRRLLFLILGTYVLGFVVGMNMEMKMSWYPNSWYSAREFLTKNKIDENVLSLPWHKHMPLSFAYDKRVYTPINEFFGKNFIVADNYDNTALDANNTNPVQMHFAGLIKQSVENKDYFGNDIETPPDWNSGLDAFGVKRIMILKEYNYKNYNFLYSQINVQKIFENEGVLILERN